MGDYVSKFKWAGPNIEPHPYDLAKMHNFYRCTIDVLRPF